MQISADSINRHKGHPKRYVTSYILQLTAMQAASSDSTFKSDLNIDSNKQE